MRVLIIGPVRDGHEKLVRLGHTLVLFMKRPDFAGPHSAAEDLGRPYESIHLFPPGAGAGEYTDIAQALHRHRPFDGVCCLADGLQHIAIGVAAALGLSFPVAPGALALAFDKHATRRTLQGLGLDPTPAELAADVAGLAAAAARIGYPVIVKPCNATGSSGVTRVDDAAGMAHAAARLAARGHGFPVLVEAFLAGEELSVEAISEGGVHTVLAVTKKYIDANFVECGHVVPAPLEARAHGAVCRFVEQVLGALGVIDGPSHTEVMLTSAGPRLIETHTRPGGDQIFELVHLATGNDLMELTVRQFIGERVLDDIVRDAPADRHAAIWFAIPAGAPGARLARVDGIDLARASAGVQRVQLLKEPGAGMENVRHSYDRSAYAIAVGASAAQALDRARDAIGKLVFISAES